MILNIAVYHFFPVDDVDALIDWLRARTLSSPLKGTVLVAPEGLNLFLAAEPAQVEAFLADLRQRIGVDALIVKRSYSQYIPFARLKIKRKREIIAFRQPDSSPLEGRAATVTPAELRRWIERGHDDCGRPLRLLDTRNREEIDYGRFVGATCLPIDNFTDLPAAIDGLHDELQDCAVVSYCTGGIRCEKAALWLQAQGLPHVYQLDGGILGYFETEGGFGYDGSCFVFDERIALRPDLSPLRDAELSETGGHTESRSEGEA